MNKEYTLDKKIALILQHTQRQLSVATEAYRREIHSAVDDLQSTLSQRLHRPSQH